MRPWTRRTDFDQVDLQRRRRRQRRLAFGEGFQFDDVARQRPAIRSRGGLGHGRIILLSAIGDRDQRIS